jgi:hypothetical protein
MALLFSTYFKRTVMTYPISIFKAAQHVSELLHTPLSFHIQDYLFML